MCNRSTISILFILFNFENFVVVFQLLSYMQLFAIHGLQYARLCCLLLSPRVCLNSCPLSRWCHPTISYSDAPFSSFPQSFPASESFPVSLLFALGDQDIGALASMSVLPMNIQSWFSLRLTGWISLLSRGLRSLLQHHSPKSSIFWHSPFFMVQLSRPHMTTTKIIALTIWNFIGKVMPMLFNMLFRFVMAFLSRSIF